MVNLTIVNCEFCCRGVTVGQAIKINFPYFSPIQWDKINLPCTVHIKLSNRSKCVIQLRHFIETTLLLYNLEFLFVTIVIFFVCCLNWVRRKTGTFIIQLPFPRKSKISNGWLPESFIKYLGLLSRTLIWLWNQSWLTFYDAQSESNQSRQFLLIYNSDLLQIKWWMNSKCC